MMPSPFAGLRAFPPGSPVASTIASTSPSRARGIPVECIEYKDTAPGLRVLRSWTNVTRLSKHSADGLAQRRCQAV